jgi:hypothetical protein
VTPSIDHLVVGARTLDEGVAWCEATLGVTPAGGGKHPLMGTHNCVFSIASERHPQAYVEIIAIDPDAPAPGRARWFDLDNPTVQDAIADGPLLIHWVLRCDDIVERCARLRAAGIERGEVLQASRGALSWRISVRPDGARLFDGRMPTLIQWDGPHPADSLPPSGVTLREVECAGLPAAALHALEAPAVFVPHGHHLLAHLSTPRGDVALRHRV